MAIWILLGSLAILIIAYFTYGSWLAKQWGIDPKRPTPAHTMADGIDYVPAKAPVLLGHHFASIAGAGPITGPIIAAVFGWVPVLLWCLVGSIFFGGVHDFGSLYASIRHEGKSIGAVIEDSVGKPEKKLFDIFSWLTLVLVVAAFANIIVSTFVNNPAVATTSLLFIVLAVTFGLVNGKTNLPLWLTTIFGVALLVGCIALGVMFPIKASAGVWWAVILIYIFIASVAPVWILLQPRDYLNSYLLYAMIIAAVIGIFIIRPNIQLPAFTSFKTSGGYLFPMLFVTVACGAVSGFHSLVASGTTSKQLDNEKNAKLIGYGSMLIEGALAVIALIAAAYLTQDQYASYKNPTLLFSDNLAKFMESFGLAHSIGSTFVALAVSAFALTSLDTATRIARFIFQEFFSTGDEMKNDRAKGSTPLTNMYVATAITIACGGLLGLTGYLQVWPIFGSANQLLAALALLAVAVYLKKIGKNNKMIILPMIFMFAVTLTALFFIIKTNFAALTGGTGSPILCVLAALLFILAVVLITRSAKRLTSPLEPVQKE
ncbi:MAG: carbon starvation protein A [Peptoniphilaceae bacterium]|nr:carbon starvation protein A [Peptoniphilaceae bacterium]MDY3076319.1 carbon starvation protein A [Peptoniphilaceae bacterium]